MAQLNFDKSYETSNNVYGITHDASSGYVICNVYNSSPQEYSQILTLDTGLDYIGLAQQNITSLGVLQSSNIVADEGIIYLNTEVSTLDYDVYLYSTYSWNVRYESRSSRDNETEDLIKLVSTYNGEILYMLYSGNLARNYIKPFVVTPSTNLYADGIQLSEQATHPTTPGSTGPLKLDVPGSLLPDGTRMIAGSRLGYVATVSSDFGRDTMYTSRVKYDGSGIVGYYSGLKNNTSRDLSVVEGINAGDAQNINFSSDGSYIFLTAFGNIYLYRVTTDGINQPQITFLDSISTGSNRKVVGSNSKFCQINYWNNALVAFSFDGSTITQEDSVPISGTNDRIASTADGERFFAVGTYNGTEGIHSFGLGYIRSEPSVTSLSTIPNNNTYVAGVGAQANPSAVGVGSDSPYTIINLEGDATPFPASLKVLQPEASVSSVDLPNTPTVINKIMPRDVIVRTT